MLGRARLAPNFRKRIALADQTREFGQRIIGGGGGGRPAAVRFV
jgi:hypothetical protein